MECGLSTRVRFITTFISVALLTSSTPVVAATTAADVVATYYKIGEAVYSDSAKAARELETAVEALLASPTAETLQTARSAWKAARVPYLQSEGFRFGNKIVDDWEGSVNSWPLDEGLIDYVDTSVYGDKKDENPLYTANVIASPSLRLGAKILDAKVINKTLLVKLNSALDVEANVATGYHAIEFLLWGQDLNGTGPGAGNRPVSDFDLKSCSGGNCDRRRAYLKAATSLLADDLDRMAKNWRAGGAARKALEAMPERGRLAAILTGLGSLSYGEMAGERMKLGVILHDTEEEQDCFSDDTHNSHYNDQVGMMAIWTGTYAGAGSVKGAGIADLVRQTSPEAAARVDDAMAATHQRLKAIKDKADAGEMAYDQMLAAGSDAGNKLVLDGVDAFVNQARAIEGAVAALKLTVKIEGSDSLDKPDGVVPKN